MTAGPLDAAGTRSLLEDPPEGLVVIDVRTDEEFTGWSAGGCDAGGHLPGGLRATNRRTGSGSVPYLVYCKAGGRSAKAARVHGQPGIHQRV